MFTVVDLFSGCGGLSKGFIDAGFDVLFGVEWDEQAIKTFEKNHKNAIGLKLDLFNPDNIEILTQKVKEKTDQLDVLVGGPPCQGFSLAGKRKEDDERNVLYQAMVTTAKLLRPKAVVLENVPSILSLYGGKAKNRIIKDFTALGYNMNVKVLYAPDYGVPQIRRRAFFVGLLNSKAKYEYPTPTCLPQNYITCEEAIGDLPSLEGIYGDEVQDYPVKPMTDYQKMMRDNSSKIYNHIGTIHDEKTIKFLKMVPEGKNYKALPQKYAGIYKYHEALTRYHSQKPSPTINTGHRSHFHYKWNRIPTVRESARLQSFPDDFVFIGNKSEQYKQVGNAVPPLLSCAIAKQLLKYLSNEKDIHDNAKNKND